MLTLSDHIIEYLDATSDTSIESQNRAIRRINQAHKWICGMKDWTFLEKSFAINTVASQQAYFIPLNIKKIRNVTVLANSVRSVPQEIIDPSEWDRINTYSSQSTSSAPQYYTVRAGQILFWPTPSANNNVITFNALRQPQRDMTLLDYSIGTISVTNGSAVVTGALTSWTSTVVKPDAWINIIGQEYEILNQNSATQITLAQPFQGMTASGIGYRIGDATFLPEAFDDAVWMKAASDFMRNREDGEQKNSLLQDFNTVIDQMTRSTFSKTTSNVMPRTMRRPVNINDYPSNAGI